MWGVPGKRRAGKWGWALWRLCFFMPHCAYVCCISMCVHVSVGVADELQMQVQQQERELYLPKWSFHPVGGSRSKSDGVLEASKGSTCVFEHEHACVAPCVCLSMTLYAFADDGASRLRPCCLKWGSVVLIELNEWSRTPLHLSDPAAPALPPKSRLRRPTHTSPLKGTVGKRTAH